MGRQRGSLSKPDSMCSRLIWGVGTHGDPSASVLNADCEREQLIACLSAGVGAAFVCRGGAGPLGMYLFQMKDGRARCALTTFDVTLGSTSVTLVIRSLQITRHHR